MKGMLIAGCARIDKPCLYDKLGKANDDAWDIGEEAVFMIPKRLTYGDTIGVVSPSHVAERERYWPMLEGLRKLGFPVKEGKNLYRDTYGYLA